VSSGRPVAWIRSRTQLHFEASKIVTSCLPKVEQASAAFNHVAFVECTERIEGSHVGGVVVVGGVDIGTVVVEGGVVVDGGIVDVCSVASVIGLSETVGIIVGSKLVGSWVLVEVTGSVVVVTVGSSVVIVGVVPTVLDGVEVRKGQSQYSPSIGKMRPSGQEKSCNPLGVHSQYVVKFSGFA
jgi:hypothetical protein